MMPRCPICGGPVKPTGWTIRRVAGVRQRVCGKHKLPPVQRLGGKRQKPPPPQ